MKRDPRWAEMEKESVLKMLKRKIIGWLVSLPIGLAAGILISGPLYTYIQSRKGADPASGFLYWINPISILIILVWGFICAIQADDVHSMYVKIRDDIPEPKGVDIDDIEEMFHGKPRE